MSYHVFRDGEFVTTAIDRLAAQCAVEDDAVELFDRARNPNAAVVEPYPGLEWDGDTAFLSVGRGGIEYQIIDPAPFAAWATMDHEYILVTYDNRACDYPFAQERIIWLI